MRLDPYRAGSYRAGSHIGPGQASIGPGQASKMSCLQKPWNLPNNFFRSVLNEGEVLLKNLKQGGSEDLVRNEKGSRHRLVKNPLENTDRPIDVFGVDA